MSESEKLLEKLNTIKETDFQAEQTKNEDFLISSEELLEQLNVIAIKMDIHKNGVLYLKEAVFYSKFEFVSRISC